MPILPKKKPEGGPSSSESPSSFAIALGASRVSKKGYSSNVEDLEDVRPDSISAAIRAKYKKPAEEPVEDYSFDEEPLDQPTDFASLLSEDDAAPEPAGSSIAAKIRAKMGRK